MALLYTLSSPQRIDRWIGWKFVPSAQQFWIKKIFILSSWSTLRCKSYKRPKWRFSYIFNRSHIRPSQLCSLLRLEMQALDKPSMNEELHLSTTKWKGKMRLFISGIQSISWTKHQNNKDINFVCMIAMGVYVGSFRCWGHLGVEQVGWFVLLVYCLGGLCLQPQEATTS